MKVLNRAQTVSVGIPPDARPLAPFNCLFIGCARSVGLHRQDRAGCHGARKPASTTIAYGQASAAPWRWPMLDPFRYDFRIPTPSTPAVPSPWPLIGSVPARGPARPAGLAAQNQRPVAQTAYLSASLRAAVGKLNILSSVPHPRRSGGRPAQYPYVPNMTVGECSCHCRWFFSSPGAPKGDKRPRSRIWTRAGTGRFGSCPRRTPIGPGDSVLVGETLVLIMPVIEGQPLRILHAVARAPGWRKLFATSSTSPTARPTAATMSASSPTASPAANALKQAIGRDRNRA